SVETPDPTGLPEGCRAPVTCHRTCTSADRRAPEDLDMATSMEPLTIQPADREWAVPEALEVSRYSALRANWRFSKERVAEIRAKLAGAGLPGDIVTLAVAGSLGRMDAAEVSDCDLLVVLSDSALKDEAGAQLIYKAVWKSLEPL